MNYPKLNLVDEAPPVSPLTPEQIDSFKALLPDDSKPSLGGVALVVGLIPLRMGVAAKVYVHEGSLQMHAWLSIIRNGELREEKVRIYSLQVTQRRETEIKQGIMCGLCSYDYQGWAEGDIVLAQQAELDFEPQVQPPSAGKAMPQWAAGLDPSTPVKRAGELYGRVVPRTPAMDMLTMSAKPEKLARIDRVLSQRCGSVTLLLENLVNPRNGAACMRTCDGYGIQNIHVVESYEPFKADDKVAKTGDRYVTVHRHAHFYDAVDRLRLEGFTLVAACLDDDAIPMEEVDFKSLDRVCIVFGNEERGLSDALREQADIKAYIPQLGMVQSFNISVSCAIFLQHLRAEGKIKPDLHHDQIAALYKQWVVRSNKRSVTLIKKHDLDCKDF